jgi:hsp70-interacting protein
MSAASSQGSGDGGDDRRNRSLQGLLHFCVENTKSEDAQGASSFMEMDQERRQFLAEVMSSLRGNDPVKVMLEDIRIITDGESSVEDKQDSLEDLQDHCEDLNLAHDFHKIGGFPFISALLQNDDSGIRWRTANLFAALVQNNPYCQEVALEMGLLQKLLYTLDNDMDMKVKVKTLYALSCFIRDVPKCLEVFTANDGFSVVLRAIQSGDITMQTKASFMIRAMVVAQPALKDTLCDIGMVEQLVSLLHREHTSAHEHLMGALLCQVQGHQRSAEECRRPELKLRQILKLKLDSLKDKPEHEEEIDYSRRLHRLVFGDGSNTSLVDR